jgi:hypothetical protein
MGRLKNQQRYPAISVPRSAMTKNSWWRGVSRVRLQVLEYEVSLVWTNLKA